MNEELNLENTAHAGIGLSEHLHKKAHVEEPLKISKYQVGLPDIYEQYFLYLEHTRGISHSQITRVQTYRIKEMSLLHSKNLRFLLTYQ